MATDEQRFKEANKALNDKDHDDTDIMDRLLAHVGDMGRYQKLLFLYMIPCGVFFAFIYFVQMFIAVTPQNHWCRVPELAHLDLELRRNLSAPGAALGGAWDKCSTYKTNWSRVLETLTPPDPDTPTIPCEHGWDFQLEDIPYHTVVSERGWVCQYGKYVPIAQAFFFMGSLVGGFLFGWMADRFGRVPTFIGSNMIGCIGGIATTFTKDIWDFAFCRFLVGLSYDNAFMTIYILLLEYVGPKHRSWVANVPFAIFFGGGCIALPWIALWIADWRRLVWYTSLPMLYVLATPWILPESARWLASKGHVNKAVDILKKFEKINGNKIPEDVLDDFIMESSHSKETNESMMSLIRSPPLRNTMLIMMFVFMSSGIIFDGLVRMSENLGLDFFITFTLASATEIPSVMLLVLVLDRWGRRNLVCGPLVISGAMMLIAMFVSKGVPQTSLAIAARFFINMAACALNQWVTELLPTGVRGLGSSTMHTGVFLATMLSPFIVYSEHIWSVLPLLVLGVLALSASGAGAVLPETRGRSMPQTIADAERIIREHSLCGKSEKEDIEVPQWIPEKEKSLIT